MMKQLFNRNEKENNEIVSKIFMGIAFFIIVILLSCWLGLFDFNRKAVTLFSCVFIVASNIPILLIYVFHMNGGFMKYVLISILSLLIGLSYCIFTFQMMILFMIPSLVAMLYMNKRLLYYSGIMEFTVVVGAHIITNFYVLQPWLEPFTGIGNIIRFGIVPRIMQLGVCFAILVILMNRILSYMEQLDKINHERIDCISSDKNRHNTDKKEYEAYLSKLTERERDVFRQMLLGRTNTQISEILCLSNGTVKNYVSSIYDKTGIRERIYFILKFGRFVSEYDQSNNNM